MITAIDTRWIFPQITGIGSYTTELVEHLALCEGDERYVLLFDHPAVEQRTMERINPESRGRFTPVRMTYGPFSPRSQLQLPRLLRRMQVEVYHTPNYMYPFFMFPRGRSGSIQCVVTLHDLIPLIFPDHAPKSKKARFFPLFKKIMQLSASHADAIITPSKSSKDDVCRLLQADSDTVLPIPEGVNRRYCPPDERPAHEIKQVLYVGRFDPYKNVPRCIEALHGLVQKHPNVHMTLIGPPDDRYPEAREMADRLKLGDHITWKGYVDGHELLAAYQESDALLLTSRYEGFGLPVLEAMACGCPVICSNVSSLPEVAGDAAVTVDPDQSAAITEALEQVLFDADTARTLREKGLARAAAFTWERTARETLEVYRRAAQG